MLDWHCWIGIALESKRVDDTHVVGIPFSFLLFFFLSISFLLKTMRRLVVGILHGPAAARVQTAACVEQAPAGQLRIVGQSTRVVGGVLVCIGEHVCVHHLPGFPALQHCHGGDRVLHW